MTKRQRGSSIQRVTLANGEIRWRFRLDNGVDAEGKRRQQTVTKRTEEEAILAQAKARTEVAAGVYVPPDRATVSDVLDAWIAANDLRWKPSTRYVNEACLKPVRDTIGSLSAQKLRAEDIDRLVRELRTKGGRGGGGRSPRTVKIAILCLSSALTLATKRGTVIRNVAADIALPKAVEPEHATWSAEQVRQFLESVDEHRLVGLFHLSALGMRRGEVVGLRWADVDLVKRVVRVRQSRVAVGAEVVAGTPKSARSRRDIPLHDEVVRALKLTRDRTMANGSIVPLRAAGDRLVAVDEAGEGLSPDRYSRMFHEAVKEAGLPVIRLHDVRHSIATLLLERGVPPHVAAAILGHDVRTLLAVYAHANAHSTSAAIETLGGALAGRL